MERAAPVDDNRPATAAGRTSSLGRGQIVNLMADLRRRLEQDGDAKLTDVQNRLVMQRLEERGTWEEPRASVEEQVEEIGEVVATVTAVEETKVRKDLRHALADRP
jgi:hypothetical protein